jgi:putative nucleotidyltransferase with HDIG domain
VHKTPIAELTQGLQLGKTLYGIRGEVMLARGVRLTPEYIAAIQARGFHSVYVYDGLADDVEPLGIVSDRLRAAAVQNLQTIYEMMASASEAVRDEAAEEGAHVLTAVPLEITHEVAAQVARLDRAAEALLDEALNTTVLAGITSLKSHDSYTFEHSVDVAFYGVVLGRKLALDRTYLKDLALGCLLHDIGKMYIDERILTKPGKLNDEEFTAIQQHTVLGYQMIRQMPIDSPRPAHIALQHHEHQDASGYPNQLFGNNRVFRTQQERFDSRRITLLAELASVADVCSALTSDRPYRSAVPVPEVRRMLRKMAGHHLNREAVEAFTAVVAPYPIGSAVRIAGGSCDRSLGVVIRHTKRMERPVVRLLFDGHAKPMPHGSELNLAAEPDTVELHALPETGASLAEQAHKLALGQAA